MSETQQRRGGGSGEGGPSAMHLVHHRQAQLLLQLCCATEDQQVLFRGEPVLAANLVQPIAGEVLEIGIHPLDGPVR